MIWERQGGAEYMNLENIAYACFGNNLVLGKHIKKQLSYLQSILPAELLDRKMDDLGCGDGKVTVMLKEILKPSRLRGFDIHRGNIRRAI
jgi:ubiquinone/menaquinone biosynthesis C-methylase UbiE